MTSATARTSARRAQVKSGSAAIRNRCVAEARQWQLRRRMAHYRSGAGVRVLHIEDRVVLRLLGDLGKVEIQGLVVPAGQHDEAEDILADFVDDLAQCYKGAGPLRHAH